MSGWFFAVAIPLPEFGLIPWGALVEKFGLQGAMTLVLRVATAVEGRLIAQFGEAAVTKISGAVANEIAATVDANYAQSFSTEFFADKFAVDASAEGGIVAEKQLVRVSENEGFGGQNWWTTLDEITHADGTYKTAAEIQQKLGLGYSPNYVGLVMRPIFGTPS